MSCVALEDFETISRAFEQIRLVGAAQIEFDLRKSLLFKTFASHFKFATRQFDRVCIALDARRFAARSLNHSREFFHRRLRSTHTSRNRTELLGKGRKPRRRFRERD